MLIIDSPPSRLCRYWNRSGYSNAIASNPDVVIILLGTNDAKDTSSGGPPNWMNNGVTGEEQFTGDFAEMVEVFRNLPSTPVVYSGVPPPLYAQGVFGMNQTVINEIFPVLIRDINNRNNLPFEPVDWFEALGGAELRNPEMLADLCHPNNVGYTAMTNAIYDVLRTDGLLKH